MKTTMLYRVFLTSLISVTIAAAVPAARGALQPRQKRLSYDEINTRIASLQSRADSLAAVLEQLRQDSARSSQDMARQYSGLSRKQAETEDALAKKRSLAAAAKAQYEKARADSAAIIAKTRDQLIAIRKELQQTGASQAALNNELAQLENRQDRTGASPGGADNKIIVRMQAQAAQRDSTVRARQADIGNLGARRDKIRQDSLQAEAKRSAENSQFHQQVVRLDSVIAAYDAAISQSSRNRPVKNRKKNRRPFSSSKTSRSSQNRSRPRPSRSAVPMRN